ncbi:hypothetical protein RhiirC2_226564 [Rhizophagus irregularis]|uniref:Ion transport domain-containing protein n=1 Tax=Rhizophagus irregularis TaxID=588596 RepID=A0A2N1MHH0_9GLOM|nr:hypothetical protein RhiirC2_226564 [Rhizophagus irregularis]
MEFFIRPNPNPFVKTINRAIYETWGGEAMINFKWEKYGRYYYAIIWIIFAALLGCFTAATTLSEDYISEKDRKILYISSIFLGIIHLIIELRQFIYDPIAWISDPWNYFDLGAYLLPTCTSIYSLKNDDKIFFLISISLLLSRLLPF